MTQVNQAIQARLKGYSIIPVSEDKKPLIDWKPYQTRLATIPEILSWKCPKYGIVTGKISNLFVLDVDDDTKFSYNPDYYRVETKRGSHYYFKWTNDLEFKITTKTNIKESIDVRGEGGYVIAWNLSNIPTNNKLPNTPKWLIDLLPNKEYILGEGAYGLPKCKDWVKESLNNIKKGNRNETFFKLASSLKARGYPKDTILALLSPKAREVGTSEKELLSVIESVNKYPQPINIENESFSDFLDGDTAPMEWIIKGLIAKETLGFICGLPESRKTWAMMDLAIEVARNGYWLGKFKCNLESPRVLFIDQERFKGETKRRFKALCNEKGIKSKDLNGSLFIKVGTTIRLDLQNSFEAFKKQLMEIQPDLVIVDSFATFHTREESNRTDIQMVLERVKELKQQFKCCFLFIDHENKMAFQNKESDETYVSFDKLVGSIGKSAAAEFIFTVRNVGDTSMVYHVKNNLGNKIDPFAIGVVDVAEDKIQVKAY